MSKDTIQAKSLIIRNETEPGMNTNDRVADILDDINESKIDAPQGSGFYFLNTGGLSPSWTAINPSSYYMNYWDGSNFRASNIYYSPSNQRLGIGTGNTILNHTLEVNGSVKLKTLVATELPNAETDPTFTKSLYAKPDGTIGIGPRQSIVLPFIPKVNIESFSSDATYYYLKVMVIGILGSWSGTPFRLFVDALSNPAEAVDVTYETTSVSSYPIPLNSVSNSANSLFFTLKFPKSTNDFMWQSTYNGVIITAVFLGCHNNDLQNNVSYTVPRIGIDTRLKIKLPV
ncbi:hypothetical protein [Chryseobacterium gambrini]|uniref:hypothetical protein n=1 Tax=Chryseobacterium gambrini TaxID=373672 RepID=UPI003D0A5ED7